MIYHLTGWPMSKAIPDKEADTVANTIHEKLILKHTCPQILLSDNIKEFTNDMLAYISQEHNYKPLHATVKWKDEEFQ